MKVFKKGKVWLNYLFDRVIDWANMMLMDRYPLPRLFTPERTHRLARFLGDLSWLLRSFPRLNAYKLTGRQWTIIFVGEQEGLQEILHLFFRDEAVVPQQIARVALWQLKKQTEQWLAGEADLIICELSRLFWGRLQAPIMFKVPSWIHQDLALPDPLESLLLGHPMKSVRHNLNRASKGQFSWYFSQAQEDFDLFYYQMYLPHIKSRHNERALLATYEDQRQRWFSQGGLVMVTQAEKPVGGVICYVKNKTCYAVEMGVLNSDPQLIQNGIKISSDWFAMQWGYQQGARTYSMGATRSWRSDGIFITKSRWRAQVTRRQKIYEVWRFLAKNLPPALQAYINSIGFIGEVDGKFFGLILENKSSGCPSIDLLQEAKRAQKEGLAGVALVSPNAPLGLYE